MGYADEIRSAATEAQNILAQLGGMAADAEGNTLFAGHTAAVVGVYGNPSVQEVMMPGGGWRKRAQLSFSITRDQLAAAPVAHTTLTRLDHPAGPITYRIEDVDTHDSLRYVLTLVKLGG